MHSLFFFSCIYSSRHTVMSCEPTSKNLPYYIQDVVITPTNLSSTYLLTSALPSAVPDKRVWEFVNRGTIDGTEGVLLLDYSEAYKNCPITITFEGAPSGTLIINNRTFSASKYVNFKTLSSTTLQYTIIVPKKIRDCSSGPYSYFLDIFVNDGSSCQSGGTNYYGVANYSCSSSLCTISSACPDCCGGVPNPLSTSSSPYNTDYSCETGFLTINYNNSTITGFSYVSCISTANNISSSTNYNLPSGVTATEFGTSFTPACSGCPNGVLTMGILGSDTNTYYILFQGDSYVNQ